MTNKKRRNNSKGGSQKGKPFSEAIEVEIYV